MIGNSGQSILEDDRKERNARYFQENKTAIYAKRRITRKTTRRTKAQTKPFMAWDGEGITLSNGSHIYTMLANSAGERIRNPQGLTTWEIFEFLLSKNSSHIHVVYGGSYDFNMWLGDLPKHALTKLYKEGKVYFGAYRIKWMQGKHIRITNRKTKQTILINDVASFFQCTFVSACDEYLGKDWLERDMIIASKAQRSMFTADDDDAVDKYNDAELANLVILMNTLRSHLLAVGLEIKRWDGPGAIATTLLKRENVQDAMHESSDAIRAATRYAYAGGRFEVFKFGTDNKTVYEYDINSAYPHALRYVPDLAAGEWQDCVDPDDEYTFGVYRVVWDSGKLNPFPKPLWSRGPQGQIMYGFKSVGWYWAPEVIVAREYVEMYGGSLRILEGYRFSPSSDRKPFNFIPAMFEERRKLKREGNGAHLGIKLGLNSLYGKTCQRVGARYDETMKEWKVPPFHQLEWAGYVTSFCRSMLLRASLSKLHSIIAMETDALFSSEPLNLPIGAALGEWEETRFDSIAYGQSGFYAGIDAETKTVKTRGIDRGSVSYETLVNSIKAGGTLEASQTRFYGVGLAIQLNDWSVWRRWITKSKNIAMEPVGKRVHMTHGCQGCKESDYHWTVPNTTDNVTLVSCQYPIPWENPNPDMILLDEFHNRNQEELGELE